MSMAAPPPKPARLQPPTGIAGEAVPTDRGVPAVDGAVGRTGGAVTSSAALEDLAHKVDRLTIDRRDPERFHLDRSEIVAEIRRLARTMEDTPRTC